MANRRTSRGQPQFLQFRPYRAIVATGGGRISLGSLVRGFVGGFISWCLVTALAAAAVTAGLSIWSSGVSEAVRNLSAFSGWILGLALIAGALGGCVNAFRR